MLIAKNIADTI